MITQERDPSSPGPRHRGGLLGRLVRPGVLSPAGKVTYWGAMLAAIVTAAIVVSVAAAPARKVTPPPPLAPGFAVPQLGHPGAPVSLASYAGRPVIVNFFASWCTPCQHETPLLARFYASQHGRVVIIGIDANDQTAAALRFVARMGVSYPVGVDPFPSRITTSYGVYGLPQTFFLDARHHIVAKAVGAVTSRELATDVALMDRG